MSDQQYNNPNQSQNSNQAQGYYNQPYQGQGQPWGSQQPYAAYNNPYQGSQPQQPYYYNPMQNQYQNGNIPEEEKKEKGGSFFGGFLTAVIICTITMFIGVVIASSFRKTTTSGTAGGALSTYSNLTSDVLTEEQAQTVINKINKLIKYIQMYNITEVDVDTLINGAYEGIVDALNDKYAEYYDEEAFSDLMTEQTGNYVGIGVTVSIDDSGVGGAYVASVNQLGNAYEVGIEPGDVLTKADGVSLADMTLNEMVSLIRGEEGTSVSITYVRNGQEYTVDIIRRTLSEVAVYYTMLEDQIGYISLTGFTTTVTADQFKDAVKDLQAQGMKGLVLDVRDNGGGLVDVCVDIADVLIDTGMVTYMQDRYGDRDEYYATKAGEVDVPIVILINGNTASASELLTLCLVDYGKAVTVGTQSFGKGIAQTTYNLLDGTAIKMTTNYYYSPNGTNIHGTGITPDYEVEMDEDVMLAKIKTQGIPDITRDAQLQKAVEVMKEKIQ